MRTSMSGQAIGFVNRARSALAILSSMRRGTLGNASGDVAFHKKLLALAKAHFGTSEKPLRVLDFGCGQRAQQTVLFQADGHSATGVDMEVATYKMGLGSFFRAWRTNGAERAVKSLARHLLLDRKYFAELERAYGHRIALSGLDVLQVNGGKLPFDDGTFDFIVSSCVFEHVDDVAGVAADLARVLKAGGIAIFAVHLFPSLSGGHNLDWLRPTDPNQPHKVPAWDHLRDYQFPANTFLNRLKLSDYSRIFGESFIITNLNVDKVGEWALTPELEESLAPKGYSRDDLLSELAWFTLLARNAGSAVH